MRILHVVAPAPVGGLERVVQALAPGQRAQGHDVHVAVITGGANEDAAFAAPLRDAGITIHRVVVARRDYLGERTRVTELCRTLRPDIVHTHGSRPDVLDADAARRCGIPTVSTVHGFLGGGLRNRLYERLQRAALKRLDAVIAVSRALARELQQAGVPPHLLHIVPNGFAPGEPQLPRSDARALLGLASEDLVMGWVGRVSREKGLDVLLDAADQVTDPRLTLAVIGDGPDRAALAARRSAHAVRWYGTLPDAGRLFPAFDAFVLSSRAEGVPIVLFEAMVARVPVIATWVGGVPDVVSDAEAALVPPDDPAALAEEIRRWASRPATAAMRARAARRRLLRDFRVGPWVARHDAIYQSVQRPLPVRATA